MRYRIEVELGEGQAGVYRTVESDSAELTRAAWQRKYPHGVVTVTPWVQAQAVLQRAVDQRGAAR